MKKKVFLTKEQKVDMIRLYGKGETFSELAKAFNVSIATVRKVCAASKKKSRKSQRLTDAQRKEIVDLRKAGKSIADIAALMGVSPTTAGRVSRSAGIKTKAEKEMAYSGGAVHLPQTMRELINALALQDEEPKHTIFRALSALAVKEQAEQTFERTNEGRLEQEEIDALLKPDSGAVIHTDDGPYLAHPLVDKKGDDFVEGIKLTLGIAAVIGLVLLALGQAGVLS